MSRPQGLVWLLLLALSGSLSCNRNSSVQQQVSKSPATKSTVTPSSVTPSTINPSNTANSSTARPTKGSGQPLLITIGTKPFPATMPDNAATKQFRKLLPLRLTMRDLNGNEKRADLATRLPVELAKAQEIHEGDLLLRGPDTVVLFYRTFPTGYRYTPLARINNPTGVAAAVGQGPVDVTISLLPE